MAAANRVLRGTLNAAKKFVFEDATLAFKDKTTKELAQAWTVLTACKHHNRIERWRPGSVERMMDYLPRLCVMPFFNHFVAGESEEEIAPVMARLREQGVEGILDYAAEAKLEQGEAKAKTSSGAVAREFVYEAEHVCDANARTFALAIAAVKNVTPQGFAALKVTALGNPVLLEEASSKIRSGEEVSLAELGTIERRLRKLARQASDLGVGVMVDAESYQHQPAIDYLAKQLQREFNTTKPTVLNTYQCYLKDSRGRLEKDLELAKSEGWVFAAKLVRGAYMKNEGERAKRLGYENPIHDSYEDTSSNFNQCVDLVLDHLAKAQRKTSVMVATHNRDSIEHTIETMERLGISMVGGEDQDRGGVHFAQLLGMSDYLTFSLAHHGLQAFKYIPYGPLEEVMPYLLRRAQENSELLTKVDEERALLLQEVFRRFLKPFSLAKG
ncbi:proline dehydrogenase [Chloropicon primus]|uniref:Proline dehydrogenase n=1 Tax=Chloropicon primus TaxID=1764295 RepID=A0A5B8MXU1_9CHLO|nr:proline dehydrogenase [Chloropicon primus]UPR03724.1 proline dehydrogenase [Chloropicon primus]|eukprot:QDZ24515.1 proline dehydrogenase [Chloropicon primus]